MPAAPDEDGAEEDGNAPEPSIAGAAFWALMDRWSVPDEAALRMIAGPKVTRAGSRPRFQLRGEQVRTYAALRAIDDHLAALDQRAASWLVRPIGGQPFGRKAPLALLERGPSGVAEALRYVEREVFRASVQLAAPKPGGG